MFDYTTFFSDLTQQKKETKQRESKIPEKIWDCT